MKVGLNKTTLDILRLVETERFKDCNDIFKRNQMIKKVLKDNALKQ